jgi:hypothetical protein
MTVSSIINTNSQTTVNATTHSFPYEFKIFADGDLEVIVRSAAGTETGKTLGTDFVVTNAGVDTGGNVLFKYNTGTSSDAHYSTTDYRPASGETVLIRRNLTLTQGTDYIENDTFSSNAHENALDRLTFITQALQEQSDRSLKISKTNTMTSTEFTTSSASRASKVLAFDSSGELSVTTELGTYRANWAASIVYALRDIVKDTNNNNIYICIIGHTSSGSVPISSNTDSAKWALLVDAATATTAAGTATTKAGEASTSAGTATTKAVEAADSASTASTKATLAENYAVKVDGEVETGKYSSKAWAIGGTDITDTAGAGSAKSWAVEADAVDGTEFSAKVYAGSGSTLDVGSAKNWALGGGDSFATSTTVGTTGLYSAKYWAEQSALSKTEFSNIYHGSSATDPTGGTVTAGDLYFNSGSSVLKFYTGSAWNTVEAVDTSELASNGFAVAMAIAL